MKMKEKGDFMKGFFDFDNIYFRFFGRIADVFILNLLFLIGCIPIITIPASFAALYYTGMRITNRKLTHVSSDFWKSYKENFKQGFVVGLIVLDLAIIFGIHYYFWFKSDSSIAYVMKVVAAVLVILFTCIVTYVFPLLAKFTQSTSQLFINAGLFAVKHFVYTILNVALLLAIAAGFYLNIYFAAIFIVIGFGVMVVIQSFWLNPLFKLYMNEEELEQDEIIEKERKLAEKEEREKGI